MVSNDDSDGAEDDGEIDKFSSLLLKEDEVQTFAHKSDEKEKLKEGERKKDELIQQQEDNKMKLNEDLVYKTEASTDNKQPTMYNSTTVLENKKKGQSIENVVNRKTETKTLTSNDVTKKDQKIETKENLKNKFLDFASGNKVLKTIFANSIAKNKDPIIPKNEINFLKEDKILVENEFDFLNFYENEIPNFGGDM